MEVGIHRSDVMKSTTFVSAPANGRATSLGDLKRRKEADPPVRYINSLVRYSARSVKGSSVEFVRVATHEGYRQQITARGAALYSLNSHVHRKTEYLATHFKA